MSNFYKLTKDKLRESQLLNEILMRKTQVLLKN